MSKFNEIAFNESFIKIYDENRDIGYMLEVDVEYPITRWNLPNDLPFLQGKMNFK